MTSYLNNRKAVERLIKEYKEHNSLIIGFDFDGTIYDYHNENMYLTPVINLLRICSDLGFTLCLFTLTPNDATMNILEKVHYCEDFGIKVSYVNESPVLQENQDKNHNPKPYFNILLDDRAGLSAAYDILLETLVELKLV